jgi:hypothetical protein
MEKPMNTNLQSKIKFIELLKTVIINLDERKIKSQGKLFLYPLSGNDRENEITQKSYYYNKETKKFGFRKRYFGSRKFDYTEI